MGNSYSHQETHDEHEYKKVTLILLGDLVVAEHENKRRRTWADDGSARESTTSTFICSSRESDTEGLVEGTCEAETKRKKDRRYEVESKERRREAV